MLDVGSKRPQIKAPIILKNPKNSTKIDTYGIFDTGYDQVLCIPYKMAEKLDIYLIEKVSLAEGIQELHKSKISLGFVNVEIELEKEKLNFSLSAEVVEMEKDFCIVGLLGMEMMGFGLDIVKKRAFQNINF